MMATIAQESDEVFEKPSAGAEIPSAAAVQLLREASLLVRKIAVPATGKGAVLLAANGLAARANGAAFTSFPGVASAGAGFPR
jgi:hypothetical protein